MLQIVFVKNGNIILISIETQNVIKTLTSILFYGFQLIVALVESLEVLVVGVGDLGIIPVECAWIKACDDNDIAVQEQNFGSARN